MYLTSLRCWTALKTNVQFAQVNIEFPSCIFLLLLYWMMLSIGDVEGFMNACLPFFTLEDIIDKLNTKYWFSTMKKDDYSDDIMEDRS